MMMLRFAGAPWSLDPEAIASAAVHLCNHSLQSQLDGYNTGDGLEGDQNMWGSARMKQYLQEETPWGSDDVWEQRVVPEMKRQTLALLHAARPTLGAKPGCFELFGMDFLLDAQLGVWLLEVNESPDLRPTTPAKAAACARMLDGLLALVLRREGSLLQHAEFDTARGTEPALYHLPGPLTDHGGGGGGGSCHGWELLTAEEEDKEFPPPPRLRRPASGRVRPSSAAAVRPVRPKSAAPNTSAAANNLHAPGSRGLRLNCERLLAAVRSGAAVDVK